MSTTEYRALSHRVSCLVRLMSTPVPEEAETPRRRLDSGRPSRTRRGWGEPSVGPLPPGTFREGLSEPSSGRFTLDVCTHWPLSKEPSSAEAPLHNHGSLYFLSFLENHLPHRTTDEMLPYLQAPE